MHTLPHIAVEMPVLAVPLSLIWLGSGLWLGRRQEALARERGVADA